MFYGNFNKKPYPRFMTQAINKINLKPTNYTIDDFDLEKIDLSTFKFLIHLLDGLLENNSATSIQELLDFINCKKEMSKDNVRELLICIWFYPGMQILIINSILHINPLFENVLKLLTVLCEEFVICENILKIKFDTLIHPYLLSTTLKTRLKINEKIKLQILEIYCSIFKTINGTSCDIVSYGEILPIILRIINSAETRLKVKGTYLLFLIISVQICDNVEQGVFTYKGLEYAIQTTERFNAINMVISPLIMYGINTKNPLLLKNVFRIYLKLLENAAIRSKLTGDKIPDGLFSKEILMILKNDYELNELHKKIVKILK
ncbi:hypothetical protein EBI_23262 [Enterocytozoon bieneusi H348]|nr:hypothetical protein EBI_23262 [Enterocytozoon bieneusi H348]|eukprot:XP_001827738.1 hypothetical protein EBI_23262 [Enterocytozoon bieneusi H348]